MLLPLVVVPLVTTWKVAFWHVASDAPKVKLSSAAFSLQLHQLTLCC